MASTFTHTNHTRWPQREFLTTPYRASSPGSLFTPLCWFIFFIIFHYWVVMLCLFVICLLSLEYKLKNRTFSFSTTMLALCLERYIVGHMNSISTVHIILSHNAVWKKNSINLKGLSQMLPDLGCHSFIHHMCWVLTLKYRLLTSVVVHSPFNVSVIFLMAPHGLL